MVSVISPQDPLRYDQALAHQPNDIEEQVRQAKEAVASLIIPLILCNHDQVLNGQCKKLQFAQPCQLSENEVCELNKKAMHVAKLIIQDGECLLKVDNKLKDLDYDEITYEYNHDGNKVAKTHKKDDDDVEVMDEGEIEEIQNIVNTTLFNNTSASENDHDHNDNESSQNAHTHTYSPNHRVGLGLSNIAIAIVLNASLADQRNDKEQHDQQRRSEDKAMILNDARKRAEKKRELRWQERQKHHKIKDENRELRLQEVRKADIAKAER